MKNRSLYAHPGCGCGVDPERDLSVKGVVYCSEHCATRGIGLTGECKCSHKGCHE
jgi:hypothetical protein